MANRRRRKTAQPQASEVSRRKFLQSVIAASAATGAATALPAAPAASAASEPAAAASGVAEAEAVGALQVFTGEQAGVLTGMLNRIIPAEGAMPAAGELGLARYIDSVLADASHLRQPILDLLNEVALASEAEVQSPEGLDALIARLECTHRDSFAALIETVYTGYYSHPEVLQTIGWEHPGTEADTSETLDAALLEDVVRRGPIYRPV
jgi:hypothetical protein